METSPPILVPAGNPGPYTGEGNNTWLLDGPEPTLVDAGTGDPSHLEALAEALEGRPLRRVLVTHDHPDHASGVPAIRECWPGVEVLAAATGCAPDRTLIDRERLRAGHRILQVLYTPGHALDHVCFWDAEALDLYSGDMVQLSGSVLIPGDRGGGLDAYLSSLETIGSLGARRIYPGHGPIVIDPAALIARTIAHRHARENQIRQCLAEGIDNVDALVTRLYADLPHALTNAARLTVEAHLTRIRATRGA